jgi:hypothetical protein
MITIPVKLTSIWGVNPLWNDAVVMAMTRHQETFTLYDGGAVEISSEVLRLS